MQTSATSLYGIPSGLSEGSLSEMSTARHSTHLPTCSALQSTFTCSWAPGVRTPVHGDNEKTLKVCVCKTDNMHVYTDSEYKTYKRYRFIPVCACQSRCAKCVLARWRWVVYWHNCLLMTSYLTSLKKKKIILICFLYTLVLYSIKQQPYPLLCAGPARFLHIRMLTLISKWPLFSTVKICLLREPYTIGPKLMLLEGLMLYFEKTDWIDTLIGIVFMVSPPSRLGSITWSKRNRTH